MNNELTHYGVKGMKWGVRRKQKKNAKSDYKSSRKLAKSTYKNEYSKATRDLDSKLNAYDRGRITRTAFEKVNSEATRKSIDAERKYRDSISKAKRDYRVSKGMKESKADKKYQKALKRSKESAEYDWNNYVESLAENYPAVARDLAEMGNIKYGDLVRANDAIRERTQSYIDKLEAENRRLRNS